MPNKNEKTPEELFDFNIVRTWKDKEHSKRIGQLQTRLAEFLNELKHAQAIILERTQDEYKDRTAQFFINHLSAVELSMTIVRTASEGILFSPRGWQKETPRSADPAAN